MAEQIIQKPAWSDEQLPAAVAAATSRRGVMRELGLNPNNGGSTLTIRRHAAWLGLDTSHFKGNRSWSDAVLRQAVMESRNPEVIDLFFTVDGDLTIYVIPSRAVGGRTKILLRSYTKYIVGNAAGLMSRQPRVA